MNNLQDKRVGTDRPSLMGATAPPTAGVIPATPPTRVLAHLAGHAQAPRRPLQWALAGATLAALVAVGASIGWWTPARPPPPPMAVDGPTAAALASPPIKPVPPESMPVVQATSGAQPARVVATEAVSTTPAAGAVVSAPEPLSGRGAKPRMTNRSTAVARVSKAPPRQSTNSKPSDSDSELLAAILRRGHGNGSKPAPSR
jgi:hypothetical protein